MLTSLCAIASLFFVRHIFLFLSVSDFDGYRYASYLTLSYTSASISNWGGVRSNGSSHDQGAFYLYFFPVYCNSLLATLNIRREILNERTKNSSFPPHPSRSPNPPSVDENGVIGSALTLSPRSSRPEDSSETINLKVFRRSIGPHSPSSSIPGSAPKLGSGDQGSIAKDKDPPFEGSFELSISKLV